MRQLVEHPVWKERETWRASGGKDGHGLRGTGLAIGGWVPNIQPTSATVRLEPDGTLAVVTGSIDIAGTNMGFALMAAEAFGVDIERVHIVTGDTDTAPLTGLSAGSKNTFTVGAAVAAAASEARQQTLSEDVGKAINPLGIEGQMQGGAVQSLGFALTEGLLYDDQARLTNPSLLDYRKLTAADLPDIETIMVEVPAPEGPFGARGVGEPPIVPAPAAIANAIEDASGLRLVELPLTPEKIALGLAARAMSG